MGMALFATKRPFVRLRILQRLPGEAKESLLVFGSSWLRSLLFCLGIPFLLAGCSRAGQPELNIDLSAILPTEWKAVGNWTPINIDADSEQEYLLFYTYDASTTADNTAIAGPIGGVIYDSQTPASVPANEADSRPPAPWLQPYTLLPSYWRGAGYGFVAPPKADPPTALEVKRVLPEEVANNYFEVLASQQISGAAATAPPTTLPANDELIVYGGNSAIGGVTHISVFWWSSPREGYGSTQIAASGGLKVIKWDGGTDRSPIREVRARYAEEDRSQLCKESTFTRYLDPDYTSTGAFRPAVYYVEGPRKLIFCYGIPETPFYPEAVVLAWLLDPTGHREMVVAEQREIVARALENFSRVSALQYHQTVDAIGPIQIAGSAPLQTKVWASLVYPVETSAGAGEETRLYEFTLEHLPTDNSRRTTDQWRVVGVERKS
ncbi:MAG: hypothetical protein DWI57_13445 [Chloroflexi bacterium]|nr:MAG: hypothetical protein DWI57_13445 [Chloroflexota bacterium]